MCVAAVCRRPWDDIDAEAATVRIDEGLVAVRGGVAWTAGKSRRSRRTFAVDPVTVRALVTRRRDQLIERLAYGAQWEDNDLVIATRTGKLVTPQNYDKTLALLVVKAGVPRMSSHGLRHTAATHMVRNADDLGELRAIADVLGHSPEMLMKVYAHALPESVRTVTEKIGRRAPSPEDGRR